MQCRRGRSGKDWEWRRPEQPSPKHKCDITQVLTISPAVLVEVMQVSHQTQKLLDKEMFYSGSDHEAPILMQSTSHSLPGKCRVPRFSLWQVLPLLWTSTYYIIYKDSIYCVFCLEYFAWPQCDKIPIYLSNLLLRHLFQAFTGLPDGVKHLYYGTWCIVKIIWLYHYHLKCPMCFQKSQRIDLDISLVYSRHIKNVRGVLTGVP